MAASRRVEDEAVASLHKYFMAADELRRAFQDHLGRHGMAAYPGGDQHNSSMGLMTTWYGSLNVVIEGWEQLGLSAPDVDELLRSKNRKLLNDLRNATFHYQRDYWPRRVLAFASAKGTPIWVLTLHTIIGLRIVNEMRARRGEDALNVPTIAQIDATFPKMGA